MRRSRPDSWVLVGVFTPFHFGDSPVPANKKGQTKKGLSLRKIRRLDHGPANIGSLTGLTRWNWV